MKEFETNRLLLRSFKETDGKNMFNNWANNEIKVYGNVLVINKK